MSLQTLFPHQTKVKSAVFNSIRAQSFTDVPYGADRYQKMDIYLPAGRNTTNTKFIVMIHGGGWTSGDKSQFNGYVDTIKRRMPDYAIFNINYRLSTGSTNTFPAQEMDIRSAIEFIAGRTNEYNISRQMVLMGASAGAHLALLQGYKYERPIKAQAIIDFFGPSDLTVLYNHPSLSVPPMAIAFVIGTTPTANPKLYNESSPINFVDEQSPPTIIFQGGADRLVSPSQSGLLRDKLESLGVIHDYVFYPREGHGWYGPSIVDSFNKLLSFLRANVN